MFSRQRRSILVRLVLVSALLCTFGAGLLVEPATAQAGTVTVSLRPPDNGPVDVGDIITLDLFISAEEQEVDSILALVQFPPQDLQVVDASGNIVSPAKIIPDLDEFPNVLENDVSNETGEISYQAGVALEGTLPSGEFRVASIRLKVIAQVPASGVPVSLDGTDVLLGRRSPYLAIYSRRRSAAPSLKTTVLSLRRSPERRPLASVLTQSSSPTGLRRKTAPLPAGPGTSAMGRPARRRIRATPMRPSLNRRNTP